jgi:hypothetical protein
METAEMRWRFLAGFGTLTVGEVLAWANEMEISPLEAKPGGLPDDAPMMISIVHNHDANGVYMGCAACGTHSLDKDHSQEAHDGQG